MIQLTINHRTILVFFSHHHLRLTKIILRQRQRVQIENIVFEKRFFCFFVCPSLPRHFALHFAQDCYFLFHDNKRTQFCYTVYVMFFSDINNETVFVFFVCFFRVFLKKCFFLYNFVFYLK